MFYDRFYDHPAGFPRFSLERVHDRAMMWLARYGARAMRTRRRISGRIFASNGQHGWRVRLPGEDSMKARPRIPIGGRFATSDPRVARTVARDAALM